MGYRLSPAARRDLDDIWDYTVRRWSLEQAEVYLTEVRRALEFLAANPRAGRSCDDIRPGYFKWTAASHVLFYRLTGQDIDVVRILHARMDFDRHL